MYAVEFRVPPGYTLDKCAWGEVQDCGDGWQRVRVQTILAVDRLLLVLREVACYGRWYEEGGDDAVLACERFACDPRQPGDPTMRRALADAHDEEYGMVVHYGTVAGSGAPKRIDDDGQMARISEVARAEEGARETLDRAWNLVRQVERAKEKATEALAAEAVRLFKQRKRIEYEGMEVAVWRAEDGRLTVSISTEDVAETDTHKGTGVPRLRLMVNDCDEHLNEAGEWQRE